MNKSFLIGLTLVCASPAVAADDAIDILNKHFGIQPNQPATIRPQMRDLIPHDGWFDSGTYYSPYILEQGGTRYQIKPKTFDLIPGDGWADEGTYDNPWVITHD